jgi:cytochrome c biogenesis protein CcmG/thiol:disulfide interchange protein DsbE
MSLLKIIAAIILFHAPAPDFQLTSLNQDQVRLSDYRGSVVVVDFWASWCSSCQVSMPDYIKLEKKYRDQGVKIIAVNLDKDSNDAASLVERFGESNIIVAFDPQGETPARYGVESMPSTFVIDRTGNVESIIAGSHIDQLEKKIEELLAR